MNRNATFAYLQEALSAETWTSFAFQSERFMSDWRREVAERQRFSETSDALFEILSESIVSRRFIPEAALATEFLLSGDVSWRNEYLLQALRDVPGTLSSPRSPDYEHYFEFLDFVVESARTAIGGSGDVDEDEFLRALSEYARWASNGVDGGVNQDNERARPGIMLQRHPQHQTLQPGDCLFRDLSVPHFLFGKSFKGFGHVAMYTGAIDEPSGDIGDWGNYEIVEMNGKTCVLSTVKKFMEHANFWGFYSIGVNSHERLELVTYARSYVGKASYGLLGASYKAPSIPRFRCDGFVEHCYELLVSGFSGSIRPPLSHRQGLFENDDWLTMTPASLRNCFNYKV